MSAVSSSLHYSPIPVPKGFVFGLSVVHGSIFIVFGILVHLFNPSIPFYLIPMAAYITEVRRFFQRFHSSSWAAKYYFPTHFLICRYYHGVPGHDVSSVGPVSAPSHLLVIHTQQKIKI